jgi:hypothetical protein
MQILDTANGKVIVPGVSPQFAMTKMDDEHHPECDLFVEDNAAKVLMNEILAARAPNLFLRCSVVPFGAASVGQALGIMVTQSRFPRPTLVYLDGDSAESDGCHLLPGEDAPEQVVFNDLKAGNWQNVWSRIGRSSASVDDACSRAMTRSDHHDWVEAAASELKCGGDTLWQAMCAEWVIHSLTEEAAKSVLYPIENLLT